MLAANQVLAVNQVNVTLSGRRILQDIGFTLRAGEFCALIGANGSGKTTLLRAILGLVAPASGTVDIAASSQSASIGYVPQKFSLDPFMPMRARDVVALGLDGNRLGLPLPSRARRHQVDEMLEAVDATAYANQRVGSLSGGQQQRVLIAHALVRRPRLLLLDEPLANLDIRGIAGVVSLLHRVSRDFQTTVLLSAHDMNPLLPVMDRIVYLAHGRAVTGPAEQVVRTEVLSRLYGYHIDVIRVHGRILVVADAAREAGLADAAREAGLADAARRPGLADAARNLTHTDTAPESPPAAATQEPQATTPYDPVHVSQIP